MMAGERAPAALQGGVAVLERSIAYALGSLAMVTPEALARPTPCRHWNLHDLLEHLHDSMAALQEAVEVGRIACAPGPAVEVPRPAGAVIPLVRDQAVRLLGAWANANGSVAVCVEDELVTTPLIAGAGAIEVAVHGWDVAEACGQHRPIPDELADELLDLSVLFIRGWDRPARFARPIAVPANAPPGDRLVAFLGRQPS
ncbi:MAG TPA: TIGR03086 family metal-binding protein [Actinoplanes sp.]|jgi:uncharacterized protein (TIGR03086 family)|nr:TIGR03086 family metal-binding protein [Actinoplanes sp.]